MLMMAYIQLKKKSNHLRLFFFFLVNGMEMENVGTKVRFGPRFQKSEVDVIVKDANYRYPHSVIVAVHKKMAAQ